MPLAPSLNTELQKEDFALDTGSQICLAKLQKRFNHYLQQLGAGGKPLGQMMLAHMRLARQEPGPLR